jgi:hypothetical protein
MTVELGLVPIWYDNIQMLLAYLLFSGDIYKIYEKVIEEIKNR